MTEIPGPKTLVIADDVVPGQHLETQGNQPNLRAWVITPLAAILIRAAKAYLQTLLGLMTAAGFGASIGLSQPHSDFLTTLIACSTVSLAPAGMSVLSNLLIFLTQLGDKFPTLKA